MPYNINEWETGDYVTAEKLNNIEEGISILDTNKEDLNNKVFQLNAAVTDDQYPSAKAVYDLFIKAGGGDSGGDSGGNIDGLIDGTITSIYNDTVEYIRDNAFTLCSDLVSVSFLKAKTIGTEAFVTCTNLITVSFPEVVNLGISAFFNCTSLTTISLPKVRIINNSAFYDCINLSSISFPMATRINYNAFYRCRALNILYFPSVQVINEEGFYGCSALSAISLPVVSYIGRNAFGQCRTLTKIEIATLSVCTLPYSNAFYSTPIAGYTDYTDGQLGSIYVPASFVDAYKSASNWSYFSDRITSIV